MTERIEVCEYLNGKTIKAALSEPRMLQLEDQDEEPYDAGIFNGLRLEFTDGSSVLLQVWGERDFEAWIVDTYSRVPRAKKKTKTTARKATAKKTTARKTMAKKTKKTKKAKTL